MSYFSKKFIKGIFFVLFFSLDLYSSLPTHFILGRIHIPTSFEIDAEITAAQDRKNKKYITTTVGLAGTIAVVYSLSCIRKAALQRETIMNLGEEKVTKEIKKEAGFLGSFSTMSVTDFVWDFSKFFADAGTVFAAGIIISFLHDVFHQKLVVMYQEETVSWFITHQTKLKNILGDIKERVIGYDVHSELLSAEIYDLKKEAHLEAFVCDICQNLAESKSKGLSYYNSLIKNLEKKYKDEFSSLEELQAYAMPIFSKKKRNLSNSNRTDLFNRDNQLRIDIAYLCDLFIKEFTTMLAFIETHNHQQQQRVIDLIETSNQFLDHMELMLNMTKEELNELSKENRGFFTVIYEYEKLFNQQIAFLDQYCNFSTL